MKIAFAIEHLDPARGGAEGYAWNLGRWLVARGHALTVFSFCGVAPDFAGHVRLSVARHPVATRALRQAAELERALAGRTFDVVQAFNHLWPADVIRPGGGVHVAFEARNLASEPSAALRLLKRLERVCSPRWRALRENERRQFADPARHFIAVSEMVADDMRRHYPAVRDRIHVIRNGVDTGQFSPARVEQLRRKARADAGIAEHRPVLLFAGHNWRLKGLHDLVGALAGLPEDVVLAIAGRGRSERYLRLAARLGVRQRVVFLPVRPMIEQYATADALAHPSYHDGFGFVVLEAMACGLPVVVSRQAGAAEVVDPAGARLVDAPGPREALVEALRAVLSPALAATARVVNPAAAARCGLEENFVRVEELYRAIASAGA